MALDRNALREAILAAMNGAADHAWSKDQVADAWADAIHDYVRNAEVAGVQCEVSFTVQAPLPRAVSTTAAQNNAGPLHLT